MTDESISSFNVSQIIMEGKILRKKKAEQKRLEDLKRIESLDEKNENGQDPLEVLPAEVWEMILSNVTELEDLETAYITCPVFQELLIQDKRLIGLLLVQALDVGRFEGKLSASDLRSLRLICKSTRDAVDLWNRRNILRNATPGVEERTWSIVQVRLGSVFFRSLEEDFNPRNNYNACLERCAPHGLDLDLDTDTLERYSRNFQSFRLVSIIEHIGEQILHLKLCLNEIKPSKFLMASHAYLLLVELMNLMPNLVILEVKMGWPKQVAEEEPRLELSQHPFPHLNQLKRLDLYNFVGKDGICNAILQSNTHVENLNVYGTFPRASLEKLSTAVSRVRPTGCILCQMGCEPFKNWPLKVLFIRQDNRELSLASLFRSLKNLQTLESLYLILKSVDMVDDGDGLPLLCLPQLTLFKLDLRLQIWDRKWDHLKYYTIDYLLGCRKLERISWKNTVLPWAFDNIDIHQLDEIIQFHVACTDLSKSNIWDLFPFLKWITVYRPMRDPPQKQFDLHAGFEYGNYLRPVGSLKGSVFSGGPF